MATWQPPAPQRRAARRRNYRRPLTPLLEAAGATVTAPTAAIKGIGNQLTWYRNATHPERRRVATQDELAAALDALDCDAQLIPASAFPGDRDDLEQPGLYSWWVDEQGAAELAEGLGVPLQPGRIYARVTGATSWPSAKTGTQTLRAPLGTHIGGRISASTFRFTLASILAHA